MKIALLTCLLLIGINLFSQSVRIIDYSGQFDFANNPNKHASIEVTPNGFKKLSIYQSEENNVVTLLKANFNKHNRVIDTLQAFDPEGNLLLEVPMVDNSALPDQEINTSFTNIRFFGIPHGTMKKFITIKSGNNKGVYPTLVRQYYFGKKNGKNITYYANSDQPMVEATYTEDILDGDYFEYHSNGVLKYKGTFVNGKKEGKHEYFHENGQLTQEENFVNGDLNGSSKGWFENGKVSFSHYYSQGLTDGYFLTYFENGKIQDSLHFKNGMAHGKQMTFYSNGKKASESTYEFDVSIGESFRWNESGKMTFKQSKPVADGSTTAWNWDDEGKLTELRKENPAKNSYEFITYFPNGKKRCRDFSGVDPEKGKIYVTIYECWDEKGKLVSTEKNPIIISEEVQISNDDVITFDQPAKKNFMEWSEPTISFKEKPSTDLQKLISQNKGVKFQVKVLGPDQYEISLHPDFIENKKAKKMLPMLTTAFSTTPLWIGSNKFVSTLNIVLE